MMRTIHSLLIASLLVGVAGAQYLSSLDSELRKTWPSNRTINIVCHGNQVPAGYHAMPEIKPFESYPHLFRVALKDHYPHAVLNSIVTTIHGETSTDGAARFATDVLAQDPDLVLIDYALTDTAVTLPNMETAWRSMIDAAQAAGVPVILVTPNATDTDDLTDPSTPLGQRAALIRQIADSEGVLVADASAAWLDALASGTDIADLLSQTDHPNLAGHQLTTDAIWSTFSAATAGSTTTLPGTSFPDDGSTSVFVSPDSLLTFTTSSFFSVNGDYVGDGGNSNANAWDGNDTLSIDLDAAAGLSALNVRWTRTDIIITGFSDDPQAAIAGGGSVSWNDVTNTLTLDVPWDGGTARAITFGNPAASKGQTLDFTFTDAQANWQATFTSFEYQAASSPAPAPLVRYNFDNDSVAGTSLTDWSGNGHTATIVPSASAPLTAQAGLFHEAFLYAAGDDPDGIVSIPAGIMPTAAAVRTFSLWFKQRTEAGQDKLFGYGTNAAGRSIDFGLEAGGLIIRHWGGNITYGSGLDFADGDAGWHHVALRVNAGATTFADVDVFLDGLPLTPQAGGATTVTIDTADSSFAIGSSATPHSAQSFDGWIDEFRAWDSALSNAQIAGLAVQPPLPTIVSFTASPQNRVPSGSAVTLSWQVENATSLTLDPGDIDVTGLTSTVVNPTAKTTYTLTAGDDVNPDDQQFVTLSIGDDPFPNIIVFFLDDFGWADWQQNGAPTGSVFHETPNMNRLAAEGLYFPNGYASTPVCSPTRGSLLTGQSPAFNKLTDWISGAGDSGKPILQAEWVKKLELTNHIFPEVLSDCGYRSIHVGKWHLGEGASPESNPLNHGFDINIGGNQYGTPPSPERYFASAAGFSNLPNLGPAVAPTGSYLTDVLTEQAVDQIRTAAGEDTAFVMYLAHYAVHTPIQAPATTVQKYQDKLDNNPGMDWQGHTNPTYAAMVEHVDLSLGAILAALEDPDDNPGTDDSIAGNTLVIFTADNGGLASVTSNRPLRDGKGGNYDGGIREPWVFWWPGKITPGIQPEPIVSHDLFPTLLTQAGIAPPAGHTVNGQDLSPLLTGADFERETPLVFHYPHWSPQGGSPHSAVRQGDWKLIYNYATTAWELYNLDTDIGESTNLIAGHPDQHAVLSWFLADGLEQLDANYPRNTGTLLEQPPTPLVTPANDLDKDGRSDLDETIQGTDPANPQSFFSPVPSGGSGSFQLDFQGIEGRLYSLETSETLTAGSWQQIDTLGPLAADQPAVLDDDAPAGLYSHRFYRIVTAFP